MSEMAFLATRQALDQAGLPQGADLGSTRTLLVLGSTSGSPITMETYFRKLFEKGGPEGQLSTSFFKVMNHSVASNLAVGLGFLGPVLSPSSACSTSAQAMILGWELMQAGLYDVVIAGGADELHYTSVAVFDIVQAASRGYNDEPSLSPSTFRSQAGRARGFRRGRNGRHGIGRPREENGARHLSPNFGAALIFATGRI